VVPSQDEEIFRVLDLVCEEETNGLQGLFASIDIVPKKEVVCLGREAAIFKESE